jgi:phosphoribosylaminoimidazolecarboxamide formyltransferase/IMP cyclohydrolase
MSTDLYPIKRALLSVTDKTGLIPLAQLLKTHQVELISTGGTGKVLKEAGIPFIEIEQFTGHPEAFDGRMKTISFTYASSLLFRRESEKDVAEAEKLQIPAVDLVVCNLYEFEKYQKQNLPTATLVEHIDIGGPLMIRAAAKNYTHVTVLSASQDYAQFIEEFATHNGKTKLKTRAYLASQTFKRIAHYDAAIANEMSCRLEEKQEPCALALPEPTPLRYGENPHQKSYFYPLLNGVSSGFAEAQKREGKALSYNNYLDADAAWKVVSELALFAKKNFSQTSLRGCAVIKHGNPCGLALAPTLSGALEEAWMGDAISSFGSIISFTSIVDESCAEFLKDKFVELLIAPDFTPGARKYFESKKNLRLLEMPLKKADEREWTLRSVLGGLLWQDEDQWHPSEVKVVAGNWPEAEKSWIDFGVIAAKYLKSNAIALVEWNRSKNIFRLVGAGMGQPNRLDSLLRLALPRAQARGVDVKDLLLVSDAFFPFPDSVEVAHAAGLRWIVQPGGSVKDAEVIKRAQELSLSMVFTGERHFRH